MSSNGAETLVGPRAPLLEADCVCIRTLRIDANWTDVQISEHLQIPETTVWLTVNLPKLFPLVRRRERLLKKEEKQRLLHVIMSSAEGRRHPLQTFAHLARVNASDQTIRRALKSMGYRRCVFVSKPLVRETAQQRRLAWAHHYRLYDKCDWEQVIFKDESAMQCGESSCLWVSRRPTEVMDKDCLMPKFRKLSSCMVWGAITPTKLLTEPKLMTRPTTMRTQT
jgi:hypothetical protein